MTEKELEQRIINLEAKIERNGAVGIRLEKSWKQLEKFRDSMVSKGFSYQMIQEFNHAVQPVQQYVNTIRNERKKLERIKEEQLAMKAAEKAQKEERARRLIEGMYIPPKFPYNTDCNNFSFVDGESLCSVKMDLMYCNNNCPYCTNRVGSYRTDMRGKVVGIRKRGTK